MADGSDASDEDPVVEEVDVFLSKSLADNLYVMQYPMRPKNMGYDQFDHLAARVKPLQKKIEMTLALDTRSKNYSSSKGEQIAVNVDGSLSYDSNERYFSSSRMNKMVLSCQSATESFTGCQYAMGLMKDGELHLTPVTSLVQMRPSLDYLDTADVRCKVEAAQAASHHAGDGGESSQDEAEEEATVVNMKMVRGESEEFRARRMASYEYLHQRRGAERWMTVDYHGATSGVAEACREQLKAARDTSTPHVSQFKVTPQEYLQVLIPPSSEDKSELVAMPDNVLSLNDLRKLELNDQIKALLMNVKVIRFSQLMSFLAPGADHQVVLRGLQSMGVLVQGCWVLKSELVYPDEEKEDSARKPRPHSAVSPELMRRVRDYAMWKFTHCMYVERKDISSIVQLPSDDVKEILEKMSRLRVRKGWEFLYEYDRDFVERHPEIVQRQRNKWALTFQSLCEHFKMPKDGEKKALELEMALMNLRPTEKHRTRKLSSRSPRKRTASGRSMSDASDMEVDPSGTDKISAKLSSEHNVINSGDASRVRKNSSSDRLRKNSNSDSERARKNSNSDSERARKNSNSESDRTRQNSGSAERARKNSDTKSPRSGSGRSPKNSVNGGQSREQIAKNLFNGGASGHEAMESDRLSGGGDSDSTRDLPQELEKFVRLALSESHTVMMSTLRSKLSLYVARFPTATVFSSGVSNRMMEEAVLAAGGFKLKNQWPPNSRPEPLFASWTGNEDIDQLKRILFTLFEAAPKIRFATFRTAVQAKEIDISDAELKKFLKDHCDTYAASYYLKSTGKS